jgi:hypothetical protein
LFVFRDYVFDVQAIHTPNGGDAVPAAQPARPTLAFALSLSGSDGTKM